MDFRSLPEAGQFTSDSRSSSQKSADPQYCSVVQCLLCWGNGNLVSANVVVDRNRILWNSLTDSKKNLTENMQDITDSIFVRKKVI